MIAVRMMSDRLLSGLCIYVVPAALGLVIFVGAFTWDPLPNGIPSRALDFSVVEDPSSLLGPRQALDQLSTVPIVSGRDTKLSVAPFWFSFAVPPLETGEPVEIELPSRHARDVTCWNVPALTSLGFADRASSSGRIRLMKSGFAVKLGNLDSPARVLCRGTFSGPGHISAAEWSETQLDLSSQRFSFESGMLEGSMLLLAAYMLILAVMKREPIYHLCAVWIFVTSFFSAITAGLSFQWFPGAAATTILPWLIQCATAALYVINFALIDLFFVDELKLKLEKRMLAACRWMGVGLMTAAFFVPYQRYLPFLWFASAFGIFTLVLIFTRSLVGRISMTTILFAASFGISLLSFFYNIVTLSLGIKGVFSEFNVPMAGMLSILLLALAVNGRARSLGQLSETTNENANLGYEKLPVALFTLDQSGSIIASNPAFNRAARQSGRDRGELSWNDCFGPVPWAEVQAKIKATGRHEFVVQPAVAEPSGAERYQVSVALTDGRIEGELETLAAV